ncbi:MAG: hypothetical protein K2Q01_06650, partial [Rickettsiales bacterium]|nr:hypothetical protein [Rickettsiales bacterium]
MVNERNFTGRGPAPRISGRDRARADEALRQQNVQGRAEIAARSAFIEAAEKASARHPEIPEQVFRDIIAAYDAERSGFAERVNDARR